MLDKNGNICITFRCLSEHSPDLMKYLNELNEESIVLIIYPGSFFIPLFTCGIHSTPHPQKLHIDIPVKFYDKEVASLVMLRYGHLKIDDAPNIFDY